MKDVTRLDYAEVVLTPDGCYSRFADGSTWGSQPHDTPHYLEIATRCGYLEAAPAPWGFAGPDQVEREAAARMAYCREHEVCHHVVGAVFYKGPSPVLYALAHGGDVTPEQAALEEAMVMTLQRWFRASERPIIGGVDWDALRLRLALLLDA